jgi:hypothetical protein
MVNGNIITILPYKIKINLKFLSKQEKQLSKFARERWKLSHTRCKSKKRPDFLESGAHITKVIKKSQHRVSFQTNFIHGFRLFSISRAPLVDGSPSSLVNHGNLDKEEEYGK